MKLYLEISSVKNFAENSTNILKWNFIIYSISPLPHAVCSCSHVNKKQSQDLGLTAGFHFPCYH